VISARNKGKKEKITKDASASAQHPHKTSKEKTEKV
jgi:hypothetical protein